MCWFFFIDVNDFFVFVKGKKFIYCLIICDGVEVEFLEGFIDLYMFSYELIFVGGGFGIEEVCYCVEIVEIICFFKVVKVENEEGYLFLVKLV